MANVKISELTALTPPDAADLVPVVDTTAPSSTKRTTVGEIVGIVNGDVDVADDGTATISELPVSKLQDGAARQLLQTDAAGTGVEWTSNVDVPGTLDVTGATTLDSTLGVNGQSTLASAAVSDLTSGRVVLAGTSGELEDSAGLTFNGTQLDVDGDVVITGDLTVEGASTVFETQTVTVEDKNIELGVVASPTDVTADGGGITLKGTTDKTINWVNATDSWTSSEHVDLASGKSYRINGTEVLSATALGSTVQISSANIPSGTIVDADVNASAAIAGTKISPDFGSQNVTTTGTSTAASFIPTSSTVPTNGIYLPSANNVSISTTATEQLRITSDRYVRLASGSGGIQFNGDTAAANALDDYEEGTWTPTLTGVSGGSGQTYTTQSGSYVKIGDLVVLTFSVTLSAKGTMTGNPVIGGIPFAGAGQTGQNAAMNLSFSNLNITPNGVGYSARAGAFAQLYLQKNISGVISLFAFGNADFTDTSGITGTISYRVSA